MSRLSLIWLLLAACVVLGLLMVSPAFVDVLEGRSLRSPSRLSRTALLEVGGSLISGAVVGALILAWDDHLETRREERERDVTDSQAAREEWTALLIQLSGQEDLSGIDMQGRDLHQLVMRHAILSGAILSNSNLSGAYLVGVDLTDAQLSGADLADSVLREAVLVGADLRGADLTGADMAGADLRGANLDGRVVLRPSSVSLEAARSTNRLSTTLETAGSEQSPVRYTIIDGARYNSSTNWPDWVGGEHLALAVHDPGDG